MNTERIIVINAKDFCMGKIADIPVELLNIDSSYQWKESDKVKKIAKEWDFNKCDILTVSFRDDKFFLL